jgi:hypothetical protein
MSRKVVSVIAILEKIMGIRGDVYCSGITCEFPLTNVINFVI